MTQLVEVSIPGSFLDDARDGMWDRAEEGDTAFRTLLGKIESAEPKKRGRGYAIVVQLTDEELGALRSEAEYKNEYWNTDAYGIKESGSTIPSYAAAAKRLVERLKRL